VSDVSLRVGAGEVVGLIGPNGSGKSTFVNAVSGLVPARGELLVAGTTVRLGRPGAISRHRVFRTYQTPQVAVELTCMENVLVASPDRRHRGTSSAWLARPGMWKADRARWQVACAALERVGLGGMANTSAGDLSYGQRRHLEIARALSAQPRMLIMDEPAAGLNHEETDRLAALLRVVTDGGPSLLIIEHKIGFIESLCQRIEVLELGKRIAGGRPVDVWKDPAVMRAYLGETP